MERIEVLERGREWRGEREQGDSGGVGAGVAVDAVGVGAGGDARTLDGAVVGAVGGVAAEDGGDGGEKVGVAGFEGVVDIGGDGAVEGHEVDGVERRAQSDIGDGEESRLGVKVEAAA